MEPTRETTMTPCGRTLRRGERARLRSGRVLCEACAERWPLALCERDYRATVTGAGARCGRAPRGK